MEKCFDDNKEPFRRIPRTLEHWGGRPSVEIGAKEKTVWDAMR